MADKAASVLAKLNPFFTTSNFLNLLKEKWCLPDVNGNKKN